MGEGQSLLNSRPPPSPMFSNKMFQSKYKVKESTTKEAYNAILRLLAKRDYSYNKLKLKLQQKGYEDLHIEEAISIAEGKGYFREESYTNAKIKTLMFKGNSMQSIKMALEFEGIKVEKEQIQDYFDEYRVDEEEQIRNLMQKKMPKSGIPEDREEKYKLKGKILRFIMSKGHSTSLASNIFDNWENETN